MHTFLTWLVRLILLMVLTAGIVIVYFIAKDAIKELKRESH